MVWWRGGYRRKNGRIKWIRRPSATKIFLEQSREVHLRPIKVSKWRKKMVDCGLWDRKKVIKMSIRGGVSSVNCHVRLWRLPSQKQVTFFPFSYRFERKELEKLSKSFRFGEKVGGKGNWIWVRSILWNNGFLDPSDFNKCSANILLVPGSDTLGLVENSMWI